MGTIKWIDLPKHEGLYEINEAGQIRTLHKRNRYMILTQRIDRGGYYTIRLSKGGRASTHWVHRLLALTYIPNPHQKPEVNHKDLNKLNNNLDNLEWVTHRENAQHAYNTGAINPRRGKDHPSSQPLLFKPTGEEFSSISEAANRVGRNYEAFRRHLRTNKNKGYVPLNKPKDRL